MNIENIRCKTETPKVDVAERLVERGSGKQVLLKARVYPDKFQ